MEATRRLVDDGALLLGKTKKRNTIPHSATILLCSLLLLFSYCNRQGPYKIPYEHKNAVVIAREYCSGDESTEFWLLNFEDGQFDDGGSYGDTISIDGQVYNHVVKTRQLHPNLKIIQLRINVGFDISSERSSSEECNTDTPTTYNLQVLNIHFQSELR